MYIWLEEPQTNFSDNPCNVVVGAVHSLGYTHNYNLQVLSNYSNCTEKDLGWNYVYTGGNIVAGDLQ